MKLRKILADWFRIIAWFYCGEAWGARISSAHIIKDELQIYIIITAIILMIASMFLKPKEESKTK